MIMDNIYLDVGNLLVQKLLVDDSFYFIPTMICLVILFTYSTKITNDTSTHNTPIYILGGLVVLTALVATFDASRNENKMINSSIQLQNELHILADKYNVDDEVALGIAQDIIFCEPNYLKYTPSKTIQCENKKYYGKQLNTTKVKENLNYIDTIQDQDKLFINNALFIKKK